MLRALRSKTPERPSRGDGRAGTGGNMVAAVMPEECTTLVDQILEGLRAQLAGTVRLGLEQLMQEQEQRLERLLLAALAKARSPEGPSSGSNSGANLSALAAKLNRGNNFGSGLPGFTASTRSCDDAEPEIRTAPKLQSKSPKMTLASHWLPWARHPNVDPATPSGMRSLGDLRDRELLAGMQEPKAALPKNTVMPPSWSTAPDLNCLAGGARKGLLDAGGVAVDCCADGESAVARAYSEGQGSGRTTKVRKKKQKANSTEKVPLPAKSPLPAVCRDQLPEIMGLDRSPIILQEKDDLDSDSSGEGQPGSSPLPGAIPASGPRTPERVLDPSRPKEPARRVTMASAAAEGPNRGSSSSCSWPAVLPPIQCPGAECDDAADLAAVITAAAASTRQDLPMFGDLEANCDPTEAAAKAAETCQPGSAVGRRCTRGQSLPPVQRREAATSSGRQQPQRQLSRSASCGQGSNIRETSRTLSQALRLVTTPGSASQHSSSVVSSSSYLGTILTNYVEEQMNMPERQSVSAKPRSPRKLSSFSNASTPRVVPNKFTSTSSTHTVRLEREEELLSEFSAGGSTSSGSDVPTDPLRVTPMASARRVKWPGSPLLLRLCGILPWGRLGAAYHYLVVLLAVGLVAVFAMQLYWGQQRLMATPAECPMGVCMHFGCLGDLLLAVGGLAGLLAMRALGHLRLMGGPAALLMRYAVEKDAVEKWSAASSWQALHLALLWGGSLACRGVTVRSDPGAQELVVVGAFALTSLLSMALAYTILHVSCLVCILIDSYTLSVREKKDLAAGIEEWDKLGAVLRRVSRGLNRGFLLVQTTAAAMLLCSFSYLMLEGGLHLWKFVSDVLLAYSLVLIFSKAAEVTEMCTRLPALINSLDFQDGSFSLERHFLVQHISHSDAGFYVGEVRLTAAMALKLVYVCILAVFTVITKLTTTA